MQILSLEEYADLNKLPLRFEQQPGWLALLHKHCLSNQNVRIYAELNGESQTVLPLYLRQNRFPGLSPRRLEGLTGLYSSHYLPQATDVRQLKGMLQAILEQENWDVLHFSAVDEGGDLHQAMASLAQQKHWALSCKPDFEHWYLSLENTDYDAYFARLPGTLRSTLKRKGAKVARQFQVLFDCCDRPERLSSALKAYLEVYKHSWKSAESCPDFIPGLCQWAAQQGWLRLGIMYLDDKPVAAQIWLVLDGKASIFKLAYDQAYQEWSVGSLLTAHMLQRALTVDKVTEIDYGKGGESYKKDWMSDCLQRIQLECYNPASLAGRLMALRHHHLPYLRDRLLDRTTQQRNVI